MKYTYLTCRDVTNGRHLEIEKDMETELGLFTLRYILILLIFVENVVEIGWVVFA